jgi:hypothetical protein
MLAAGLVRESLPSKSGENFDELEPSDMVIKMRKSTSEVPMRLSNYPAATTV